MQTTDYDKFKLGKISNRQIRKSHVRYLEEQILEFDFLPNMSILTDMDHNIIDGQHRFLACKNLKLPILYEKTDKNAKALMIALNRSQKTWRLYDWVHFYMNEGIPCYNVLFDFEERYKLGYSVSIPICFLSKKIGSFSGEVASGKTFEINPNKEEIAALIKSLKELLPYYKAVPFVLAICKSFPKLNNNDLKRLIGKLPSIPNFRNPGDFLIAFENILNYGRKKENFLTLR